MKQKLVIATFLLSSLTLTTSFPVFSQPNPINRYQPGFWQPEAKINPNLEIKVQLLNQTSYTLEYGKADSYPKTLPPGSSTEVYLRVSSRKGDIATIPINAPQETVPLKYEYHVSNNIISVRITPTSASDPKQGRAVYIDETGRVYTF